ncbi:MAG TPA: fluoride efflux transporter CrcB [Thermoanaerobaculia bacterium]|nr:fluoride efflux transporter CrcB [Thermoanaerobaculia bacterium]
MIRFLWICLGGAVGTGARYLVVLWAARSLGTAFPAGTLLVNLVGSFLLGFLMHVGSATELLSPTVRLALTTGIMGGFTTYSAFSYETADFLRRGAGQSAALNVIATVVGCLLAVFGGIAFGRLLVGD